MATTYWIEQIPGMRSFLGFWRGIWGPGGGKFTPSQNYSSHLQPRQILLDCTRGELMNVATNVPHLNTVISTGAELFSMMQIKHFDKDGEEVENSKVLKLLRNPNPLQNQEQFTYYFYVMNFIYGQTFQYKLQALSFGEQWVNLPKALWILPSGSMEINTTGKMYRQTDLKEIIKNFKMQDDPIPYEVDQVIYMVEGVGIDPLQPVSKIVSLQIVLSNIVASLKSRNIIITERGLIGFISPETVKDADGGIPLDEEEHERIRKEYQDRHHLDSTTGHVGVFKHPMKWNQMTLDVKQLMLSEGTEEDFSAIVAAARHDRDIYPSVKGATFENKSAGMKSTIQNGIQPLADKLMRKYTSMFIDPASGEYLEACYDHLPSMQEDELKKQQAEKTMVEKLSKLFEDGLLTREQYAVIAEIDLDAALNNAPQTGAQAKLRGLVGSLNGIAFVNQQVATGFIDPAAAQNILVYVFGYEPGVAASMITKNTVDPNTPAPTGPSTPKE